jgi:hypothetical protein
MFINKTRDIKNINGFNDAARSLNSKIQIVLKIGDDDLRFTLSEALTAEEDTALDNLVATFDDSDPELVVPKIFSVAKAEAITKHFHNINYKKELTQALIPLRTVTRGEVTKVEWFKSLDAEMKPTDLVIKVDVVYNRDVTGFATSRVTTRTWINEDGSENPERKVTNKYYFVNPSDMIDEGLRRRKLLVNSIQIPTLTFMTEVLVPLGYTQEAVVLKGRAFMDDYEQSFSNFVENSSTITDPASPDAGMKTIVVKLRDESSVNYNEWLDKAPASLGGMTTIRQYLINEFNI